jgi:hypothetical protein
MMKVVQLQLNVGPKEFMDEINVQNVKVRGQEALFFKINEKILLNYAIWISLRCHLLFNDLNSNYLINKS